MKTGHGQTTRAVHCSGLVTTTHRPAGVRERKDYQHPEGESRMEKDPLAFLLEIQPEWGVNLQREWRYTLTLLSFLPRPTGAPTGWTHYVLFDLIPTGQLPGAARKLVSKTGDWWHYPADWSSPKSLRKERGGSRPAWCGCNAGQKTFEDN